MYYNGTNMGSKDRKLKKNKNGICALTDQRVRLVESHIIPKFFYKYLKDTGGTYFKSTLNPKLEIKDGVKIPLLGEDAEQMFSPYESWFKQNVFDYHINSKIFVLPIKMTNELYYFSVSLLWRCIHEINHIEKKQSISAFTDKQTRFLIACAEKEWKEYLKNKIIPIKYNRIYIAVVTSENHILNLNSNDVQYYINRCVDMDIIRDNQDVTRNCALYCKCPHFMFFADLTPNSGDFIYGHLIKDGTGGIYGGESLFLEDCNIKDPRIAEYIEGRAMIFNEMTQKETLSEKQIQQINKRIDEKDGFDKSKLNSLLRLRPNFLIDSD